MIVAIIIVLFILVVISMYNSLVRKRNQIENAFSTIDVMLKLKASENFLQLQRSLNETEEQLAAARRTYNASVTDYNNAVQTFPTNLLAGMFGFTRKAVLTIPEAERATPDVKNLFNS